MSTYLDHETSAVQVAKELENQGYSVVMTPSADHIPFPLPGYVPDLLATKGGEHLIVEIKNRSLSQDQAQRFRDVIAAVEAHPGWRFLLKTVPNPSQTREDTIPESIELGAVASYLARAERIIDAGVAELAVPYLWNAVIALLRYKATLAHISSTGLSDRSLINQLYSMGVISNFQYENLVGWNRLRNSAVHDLSFVPGSHDVKGLVEFAKNLVTELTTAKLSPRD